MTELTKNSDQVTNAALAPRPNRSGSARLIEILGTYGTLILLGLMIVVFSVLLGGDFLSLGNVENILVQSTVGVVIGLGLTVVLMVGEFDLSIGYVSSLCCIITASYYAGSIPNRLLVVLLILAAGVAIGLVSGLIVTKLGVNALVATIGVGSVVFGINYMLTNGSPQTLDPSGVGLLQIFLGSILGVPWAIVLLTVVVAAMWWLLNKTTFGLEVQAVGGNRTAAELSGIRVHRVLIAAFCLGGVLSALGGLLITANVGSGQITGGEGYLLSSFAAAFLGSAALRNGEFHVIGTLIGVVTVTVGTNGMAIYGVSPAVNYIFQGVLLIAAVAMSTAARGLVTGRRVGH
ncbi:ABC transporter permease [Aeromicrobium sp. CF4.19]|uniref:ABC transporter permease n=1 Tax=Aeromicrobium sp. CF4.19 TaxID=3373082 RepID=UPI003EE4845A